MFRIALWKNIKQFFIKNGKRGEFYSNHLSGMSWNVPSGNVRLMVIGKIAMPISFSAMSIGLETAASASTRIGAPMLICKARAPTILAFSNRVTFGGPTSIVLLDIF
jgi:hypothetical protein